jgi:SSS family solute:Na+ symporter
MLGLLFWKRATASGAFWSIVLGGSAAVLWTMAGEPHGYAASYIGWGISLPTLVVVSLLTDHTEGENLDIFYGD